MIINAPVPERRVYFESLESLRGIAAVIVVIYHTSWLNPLYEFSLIRNGALMVDLFFVLSGFVIVHSYGKKIESPGGLARFMWLRLGRIYPLHFAFLMVFLAIEVAKYVAETQFEVMGANPAFSVSDGTAFFYNLLLVHSLGFLNETTFNAPSWSISTEFYTYLLFGAVALVVRTDTLRSAVYGLMVALSLAIIVWAGKDSLTFVGPYSFFRCTFGFFIGCLMYQLLKLVRRRHWPAIAKRANSLSLITLIALALLLIEKYDDWREFLIPPVAGLLVLSLALLPDGWLSKTLTMKPLKWLGKVSYSVYMVHMAIVWVFSQCLSVVLKVPSATLGNESVFQTSPEFGALLLAVLLASVLLLSHFTYTYIENPFRKKAKEWVDGKSGKDAFGSSLALSSTQEAIETSRPH